MEKDICPNCGKKELEKIQLPLDLAWLEIPGYEDWGCAHCGQSFFKKLRLGLDKSHLMCYNKDTKKEMKRR